MFAPATERKLGNVVRLFNRTKSEQKLNKIITDIDKFNFNPSYGGNQFLNIKIDGEWVDKLLSNLYPEYDIIGTIPTLSFRLETQEEEKIVWERFLPALNETTIAPILMCSDDCDFSCTLILAEIENIGHRVYWKRFGQDNSKTSENKENVGSNVKWFFPKIEFEFDILEYEMVISDFRSQYDLDNEQYDNYSTIK